MTASKAFQNLRMLRPSAIHGDGDFGDVLGVDVAYWKNGQGQTLLFTHVMCESTLFHMAVGAGR